MWLGELISERGLGNGISFIIFAGIVGRIPHAAGADRQRARRRCCGSSRSSSSRSSSSPAVVFINEGQRRIPVQYASRVRGRRMYQGQTQYLPLKVTMAGVIPIIFADQHPALPGADRASTSPPATIDVGAERRRPGSVTNLSGRTTARCTGPCTSCWSSSSPTSTPPSSSGPTRPPTTCARTAASSPGIRPGKPTEDFLGARHEPDHARRRALPGAPRRAAAHRVRRSSRARRALQLGGTSILIVVSVVVETMKQLEAQMLMRHYEGFIR